MAGSASAALAACEAPDEVRRALAGYEFADDARSSLAERTDRREALVESLLKQYPDDLFVHLRYQGFYERAQLNGHRPGAWDRLAKDYESRLAANPGDPAAKFLAGAVLRSRDPKAAVRLLNEAANADSGLPLAHLLLFDFYSEAMEDREAARPHLEKFLAACATNVSAYGRLLNANLPRPALMEHAQRLRLILETRTEPVDLAAYSTLWELELRHSPTSALQEARSRIRQDLQRIRKRNLNESKQWLESLEHGYRLLDDRAGWREAHQLILSSMPDSALALRSVVDEWHLEFAERQRDPATRLTKQEQSRELLRASSEWVRKWPNHPGGWMARHGAIESMESPDLEEISRTGEAFLKALEANPVVTPPAGKPPFALQVAELFLRHQVSLDRVPVLAEKSLEEARRHMAERAVLVAPSSILRNPAREAEQWLAEIRWRVWTLSGEAFLATGNDHGLAGTIAAMEQALLPLRLEPPADPGPLREYHEREARFWEMNARLTEKRGSLVDSLSAYRNAFLHHNDSAPTETDRRRILLNAHSVWQKLNGTERGWQSWLQTPGTAVEAARRSFRWVDTDVPLPQATLTTADGKPVSTRNWRGRATIVAVWASWGLGSKQQFQLLADLEKALKAKGRSAQIVTVCVDEDAEAANRFAAANGNGFPVLLAPELVNEVFAGEAVPHLWLIDSEGVIRRRGHGIPKDAQRWIDMVGGMVQTDLAPRPLLGSD